MSQSLQYNNYRQFNNFTTMVLCFTFPIIFPTNQAQYVIKFKDTMNVSLNAREGFSL